LHCTRHIARDVPPVACRARDASKRGGLWTVVAPRASWYSNRTSAVDRRERLTA